MLHWRRIAVALCGIAVLGGCGKEASSAPPPLRLDGIGPLNLGMSRDGALATGWLANQPGRGCTLGPPPHPVTHRLAGPRLPDGYRGVATFRDDKLSSVLLEGRVRTDKGVAIGKTTVTEMVAIYRESGLRSSSEADSVFQTTFVSVMDDGRSVLGGTADDSRTIDSLAIPHFELCE